MLTKSWNNGPYAATACALTLVDAPSDDSPVGLYSVADHTPRIPRFFGDVATWMRTLNAIAILLSADY